MGDNKVYLVMEYIVCEGSDILFIYKNKNDALEKLKELWVKLGPQEVYYIDYGIEEMEVL